MVMQFFKVRNCACRNASLGGYLLFCARTFCDQHLCQIWGSYLHPLRQHEIQCQMYKMGDLGG